MDVRKRMAPPWRFAARMHCARELDRQICISLALASRGDGDFKLGAVTTGPVAGMILLPLRRLPIGPLHGLAPRTNSTRK
jgi:hypothetical protein